MRPSTHDRSSRSRYATRCAGFDDVVLIIGEGKRDNSGDVATVDGYVTDLTIDLMP